MKGLTFPFSYSKIRNLILIFIYFFGFIVVAIAVPVVPNEAVLIGTVMEYCMTSSSLSGAKPEQVLFKVIISVGEVEDVKDYPNFLKSKEGQSVTFYSKEKLPSELFGKKIKALAVYIGDERGGIFWIKHIEIIK